MAERAGDDVTTRATRAARDAELRRIEREKFDAFLCRVFVANEKAGRVSDRTVINAAVRHAGRTSTWDGTW